MVQVVQEIKLMIDPVGDEMLKLDQELTPLKRDNPDEDTPVQKEEVNIKEEPKPFEVINRE